MSETAKRIKKIVDGGLSPLLKSKGFRKNSTNFSRKDGEALQVINIQSSNWNISTSGRFTINIGVHFATVAQMLGGTDPMPSPPKEYYCLLRRRVGQLIRDGRDHWWKVTPESDIDALAAELNLVWENHISLWLEKTKTVAGAAPELEEGLVSPMAAAAARLVLGEREKAENLARAVIERFKIDLQTAHPVNTELIASHLKTSQQWAFEHNLINSEELYRP